MDQKNLLLENWDIKSHLGKIETKNSYDLVFILA